MRKIRAIFSTNGKPNQNQSCLVARVFPRLTQVTCVFYICDWLIVLFTSVLIGPRNYFGFGFCNTQLKTALDLHQMVKGPWLMNKKKKSQTIFCGGDGRRECQETILRVREKDGGCDTSGCFSRWTHRGRALSRQVVGKL